MEYLNLTIGIILIAAFVWIFMRNRKRKSLLHAFLHTDTIIVGIAGIYLVISSANALLF